METLLVIVFILGYSAIAFEQQLRIDKAATALVTGALCWTIFVMSGADFEWVNTELAHHLGELSGILFFLLGAMTVVELIDAHDGFDVITTRITQTDKRKLLWIISILCFFFSAVLDNLTTTIVMVSLLRKLIRDQEDRLTFCGMVIISANAGGVWSPIGDVTTTMLWIGGQITSANIVMKLILPALVCLVVPLIIVTYRLKGNVTESVPKETGPTKFSAKQRSIVFFSGLLILLLVPVFKTVTHLPPYMGILFGLGILWIITEIIHRNLKDEDKHSLSVSYALRKIDTPSILFFFGILAAIAALQSSGLLGNFATWLTSTIKNESVLVMTLGLLSAVVDNVPLVAAVQGMFTLEQYPVDHNFWEFLAYCTGTGGSTLVIGSAAGVAAMGIEKITFGWYLKKFSIPALASYFSGAIVYILIHYN